MAQTEAGELLRRAATALRNPYLCNFPNGVAMALADLFQVLSWFPSQADRTDLHAAERAAREILISLGLENGTTFPAGE